MAYSFYIVDAFAGSIESSPLFGNPAAVVVLDQPQSDEWLQRVAAEFNLSETAYLLPQDNKDPTQANSFQLRWFTPTCEVKLCGHATLAAAQVLSRELKNSYKEFRFSTLSGELKASVNHSTDEIALTFPRIEPKRLSNIYVNDELGILKELGINPVAAYQADNYVICELANAELVKNYAPDASDFAKIATIKNAKGLTLTAASKDTDIDCVSRFFAPAMGVNEDPATGSAHCSLAVLWSQKLGKEKLRAYQASQRGGLFNLTLKNNAVILAGQCITFAQGHLTL